MATFATVSYSDNEALCLGLVDALGLGDDGGLLYLHMAGPENIVNAITARLLADDSRGSGYASQVHVSGSERESIYLRRFSKYHIIRSRLDNANIATVLLHPEVTVNDDYTGNDFYIITHETESGQTPAEFFPRLNKTLAIPLRPEWADWLFQEGQKPQTVNYVSKTDFIANRDLTPISTLDTQGPVLAYRIHAGGDFDKAWLNIVRHKLGLWVTMHYDGAGSWAGGPYCLTKDLETGDWLVMKDDKPFVRYDGLPKNAILEANTRHGTALILGE